MRPFRPVLALTILSLSAVAGCTIPDDPPAELTATLQHYDFAFTALSWAAIDVPSGTPSGTEVTYRVERRTVGGSDWIWVDDVVDTNPTNPDAVYHSTLNHRFDESDLTRDPTLGIPLYNRLPEASTLEYRVYAFHPDYGQTNAAYATVETAINSGWPTSWETHGDGRISLSWRDNSSIEQGYEILRGPADDDGRVTHLFGDDGQWRLELFESVAVLPAGSAGFVDTTASSGETYLYLVTTFHDALGLEAHEPIGDTAWGITVP